MRYVLLITAALLTSSAVLGAEDASFELILKEHQFAPAVLTIPADKRIKLTIKNLNSRPQTLRQGFQGRKNHSRRRRGEPLHRSAEGRRVQLFR